MKKRLLLTSLLLSACLLSSCGSMNYADGPESDEEILAQLPDIPNTPDDKDSWDYHGEDYAIDWFVDYSWFSYPGSGSDIISKKIKEETGVTVRFTSPLDETGQMLATMIAGDTLPDVVSVKAYTPAPSQLANERYVWPIDMLAEKWAPSLLDRIEPDIFDSFKLSNNHLYGLPACAYSNKYVTPEDKWAPNGAMVVRKDWYEWYESQSDKKDITTPDGLLDAMLRVKEHFEGNGEGQVSNLSPLLLDPFTAEGNNSVSWLSQYFATPFEDKDGNYIDSRLTDQYKETLAFLNKCYNNECIRTSNLSGGADAIGSIISRGEAFVSLATVQNYTGNFINSYRNGVEYIPLIVRNEAGEDPILQDLTGTGFIFSMITKNAKKIDQIIKVFDFLYSEEGQRLCSFGIEGETWNWNEDKTRVQWTDKFIKMKKAGELDSWGFGRFNVMYNNAYIEPISPLEGKTVYEAYFDNIKRPLTPFSYRYNASWPKLDPSDKDYVDYVRKTSRVLAVWSEKLPTIISAANEAAAMSTYESAIRSMDSRGRKDSIDFIGKYYASNKELLNITYGWPLNDPNFKSPTLRNEDGTYSDLPVPKTGDPYYYLDYKTITIN